MGDEAQRMKREPKRTKYARERLESMVPYENNVQLRLRIGAKARASKFGFTLSPRMSDSLPTEKPEPY
jgi:hypothetical protein